MKKFSTKSKKNLISIITVVKNGDKYLEKSIKSVLSQKYKNFELIIIDGGSTDNSLKIIKKLLRANKIIKQYFLCFLRKQPKVLKLHSPSI